MARALKIFLIAIVVIALVVVGILSSDYRDPVVMWAISTFLGPKGVFDPTDAASPPDYSNADFWAALPGKSDPSDLIPQGTDDIDIQGKAPVDVFFIHPTGFLKGSSWTSPMDVRSGTEENTFWMMANQASAYNGCCNVYAPRYREASIFAYVGSTEAVRDEVLGFAYRDVAEAFEYFLNEYNDGRPFIVPSHSQGTHHAMRLLKEEIDGTVLRDRMVAAYIIGSVNIKVSKQYFESMASIAPCRSPTDLGCVIHWDTYGERGREMGDEGQEQSLCTNPLTWTTDEGRAAAALHRGAVPVSGTYNLKVFGDDQPKNGVPTRLEEPLPRHTWAQCRGGLLYVADQKGTVFDAMASGGNKMYHGLDYPLFHMDIRENAKLRVNTFLEQYDTAQTQSYRD